MKTLFFLCISCCLSLLPKAQSPQPSGPGTYFKLKLEEVEVKDSAGTVYPTELVRKLMAGGKYGLKLSKDHTQGLLYKLSNEEIEKRIARSPKPKESNFFKTGEKISSFNERDIRGNKHNLKELAGKVVVLNFWFINCPPCRAEIPELNELVDSYAGNTNVEFIAVALDEQYEIEQFLKLQPYKYSIIDRGKYIASKYNINLYPTHVVLNKEGKVLFHTSGLTPGTVPWLKKSIEAGLNDTVPQ